MGLEVATYISQLDALNPLGSDPKSQGDDHLRLIKAVLKAQFPNLTAAAVNATAAELSALSGSGITLAALQKLVAITATAGEINALAGSGVTLAAVQKLVAITASAAQLNTAGALGGFLSGVNANSTITDEVLSALQSVATFAVGSYTPTVIATAYGNASAFSPSLFTYLRFGPLVLFAGKVGLTVGIADETGFHMTLPVARGAGTIATGVAGSTAVSSNIATFSESNIAGTDYFSTHWHAASGGNEVMRCFAMYTTT